MLVYVTVVLRSGDVYVGDNDDANVPTVKYDTVKSARAPAPPMRSRATASINTDESRIFIDESSFGRSGGSVILAFGYTRRSHSQITDRIISCAPDDFDPRIQELRTTIKRADFCQHVPVGLG